LEIMKREKVADRQLVLWMQNSMGMCDSEKTLAVLEKWVDWKSHPQNATKEFSFREAIEFVLGMEAAAREYTVERKVQRRATIRPVGDASNPKNGGKGDRPNPKTDAGRKKTQQEKWGDVCPDHKCSRREHTQAKMDKHLKECYHNPKTQKAQTNFTRAPQLPIKEIRVCGAAIIQEKFDYWPIMSLKLAAEKGEKPTTVEEVAFFDSGSGKLLLSQKFSKKLVGQKGFEMVTGQRYRVQGVDESGTGVWCDQPVKIYFAAGKTIKLTYGLVVKGLPEPIIAGCETMRLLHLSLHNGDLSEENFLESKRHGIHRLCPRHDDEKRKSMEAARSFLSSIQEEKLEHSPTKSLLGKPTQEDLSEVFEEGRRVTFAK
jgi:hypothetical protein